MFRLVLTSLCFLYASLIFASSTESEDEFQWSVDKFDAGTVIASTPGYVMYGDKLRVRVVSGGCDYGQLWTSIYTIPPKGTDPAVFKNKKVTARFMGQKMEFPVMHAGEFLLGYLVMLDMGVYELDTLSRILSSEEELKMDYLDSVEFKSKDYLDIPFNSWSTKGLGRAIKKAAKECSLLNTQIG